MFRYPRSSRSRGQTRWLASAIATSGAVVITAGVAVAGPSQAASATAAGPATASTGRVACTKRLPYQPPPLGVLKPVLARGSYGRPVPVARGPRPVCPPGEVPVVKSLPVTALRGNGNPDQARRRILTSTAAAAAAKPQPGPDGPSCDGTNEDGACYYWASASDVRNDQGGGVTMKIERPALAGADASSGGDGHSLEEMSVQAGPGDGNIVEIGSTVVSGDPDPQLFVYHWIDWKETCYNGCGYAQYSNTYWPGMDLKSIVGQQVYNGYVYYQGRWWAWFNDQWLGSFPGSIWDGQFQESQQVQWFGEVATQNGVPPLDQMGDGLFASNPAAAPMSTLCDVNAAAWRCYYYNQQTLFQSDANYYTIQDTGFGSVRLGGPGT